MLHELDFYDITDRFNDETIYGISKELDLTIEFAEKLKKEGFIKDYRVYSEYDYSNHAWDVFMDDIDGGVKHMVSGGWDKIVTELQRRS